MCLYFIVLWGKHVFVAFVYNMVWSYLMWHHSIYVYLSQFIATIHRRLLIPKGSENSGNPTQHDQNIQVKD